METTRLSTKGQIVIPEAMRANLTPGTVMEVARQKNVIILKPVEGLTQRELEEMSELAEIWKDIDAGKCKSYSESAFFKQMSKW